jgi:uncharacterized MAPEG superfamily protein
MKPELTLLVCAAGLTVVQMVIAVVGAMMQVGLADLAGNRERMPEITGWAGRAARAHRNMLESLVLFAALALVIVVAGRGNAQTVLGAQIFVWARLIYAVVYIAGISWLRTGVWAVGLIGLIMMFVQAI